MDYTDYYKCEYCNHKPYTFPKALITHVKKAHPTMFDAWANRRQRARIAGEDVTPGGRVTALDRRLEADIEQLLNDSDEEPEEDQDPDLMEQADTDKGDLEKTRFEYSEKNNGRTFEEHELPDGVKIPGRPTELRDIDQADEEEDADGKFTDRWGPFQSEAEFELSRWFIDNDISKTAIDQYFGLCKRFPEHFNGGSFTSAYTLLKAADLMPLGISPDEWKMGKVKMRLERDVTNDEIPGYKTTSDGYVPFYVRDPKICLEYLLKQARLDGEFEYEACREFNEDNVRLYSEVHTCNWMWDRQVCSLDNFERTPTDQSRTS